MSNVKTSETICKLIQSLRVSQQSIGNVTKDKDNAYFKSKYADLSSVIDAIKPVMCQNGLSYSQHPSFSGGIVSVETIIFHDSGEWMSSVSSTPIVKSDPQGVGSAITYLRRYALSAIMGITQEDDDGNSASNNDIKKNNQKRDNRSFVNSHPEQWKKIAPQKTLDEQFENDNVPDFSIREEDMLKLPSYAVKFSDSLAFFNGQSITEIIEGGQYDKLVNELSTLQESAKKDTSKAEIELILMKVRRCFNSMQKEAA